MIRGSAEYDTAFLQIGGGDRKETDRCAHKGNLELVQDRAERSLAGLNHDLLGRGKRSVLAGEELG